MLYNFEDVPDGAFPNSALVRDAAGNLYGTTSEGGIDSLCAAGCGVVFKLDASGHESVLLRFVNGVVGSTGAFPSGVALDSAGNIFGVTETGGANLGGVLYKVDRAGTVTVLHSFSEDIVGAPNGVILEADGAIYGTTVYGGTHKLGVLYKFDSAHHYSVLYNFPGGANGSSPISGVLRDAAGNLYGTTESGGGSSGCSEGCGVVYKVDPAGNESVLHSFDGTDG